MAEVTDWISAISGVSGLLIAFVTLLTVYIAALQFVSQRRISRHGLSCEVLGPWQRKVVASSFLGLEKRITTPAVSMENLVREGWTPRFDFAVGLDRGSSSDSEIEAQRGVLAKASWVNFMEAISISPDDASLVDMRYEGELVNGSLPMRWKGPDLVAVCALLGFSSTEQPRSPYASPFMLPMQWTGPLGWLQFRAGFEGCVVEFRQRATWLDELDAKFHNFYRRKNVAAPGPSSMLKKACYSMGGLYVEIDGQFKIFHIGPPDMDPLPQTNFGAQSGTVVDESAADQAEQSAAESENTTTEKYVVIDHCPSRLSQKIHRDRLWNRGIDLRTCLDYAQTLVKSEDDINRAKYPHRLGSSYIGREALSLCKNALLHLKPDGFYFVVANELNENLEDLFWHVWEAFDGLNGNGPLMLPSVATKKNSKFENLAWAVDLCNTWRSQLNATLSVPDMEVLRKASYSLGNLSQPDLVWALLSSPDLFSAVAVLLSNMSGDDILDDFLNRSAVIRIRDEVLQLPMQPEPNAKTFTDAAPLCSDGEYNGAELLASFADLSLTFYWICKKWGTDVDLYTASIPLSVMMF